MHLISTFAADYLYTTVLMNFEELGIRKDLVKGIKEINIITPTQIQKEAIPILLKGNVDLVGQAQTGTGKTAAYGLPLLQRVDAKRKVVQGLILVPTRELGQQVAKQLFKFTKYSSKIFAEAVYGGAPIDKQIYNLKRPTHIVVATPGRLIDLLKKKAVDLKHVETVILDEADEMLSMGFKDELDQILKSVSKADNKWLFSATLPHGIRQIINQHLCQDAIKIQIGGRNVVNKHIKHQYITCEETDKLNVLLKVLQEEKGNRGLIFCRTKAVTQKLAKQLIARNISADAIHGDLLQKERDKVMRAFKSERLQILIATDLAARGIDIPDLPYVVHFQLPDQDDYYTHRSGRTARAGKQGNSLCIVTSAEMKFIRKFEKNLNIAFDQVRI